MTHPSPVQIFDINLLRLRKSRAIHTKSDHDFLFQHVGHSLVDRLYDIQRDFKHILIIGEVPLALNKAFKGKSIKSVHLWELQNETLPFQTNTFDLIISNLCLHWMNDLPGFFIQIKNILTADGLFLSCLFGEQTLHELRQSLIYAENKTLGGISPRVSPFLEIKDAGALLQRAGLNLPVVDKERIHITYPDPINLLKDLRGMGETNMITKQNKAIVPRTFFPEMSAYYTKHFSTEDQKITASFDVLFLHGWKPHESQQKPLQPGSANISLATFLNTKN